MTEQAAEWLKVAIEVLTALIFLSAAVSTLIETFVKPIFVKFHLDTWWLLYVALAVGGLVGWATGLNAFVMFRLEFEWLGRLLTAAACGGGPSLLYNLIDKGQPARLPMTPSTIRATKATTVVATEVESHTCKDSSNGCTGCSDCKG